MGNIYNRSYEIFKPLVTRMNYLFVPLDEKLRIARIKTSYEKYGNSSVNSSVQAAMSKFKGVLK